MSKIIPYYLLTCFFRYGIILFFLGLLYSPSIAAQNTSASSYIKEFRFKRKNKRAMILKFKLINNLIVMPIQINTSDTLNFILDSGVNNTLITELGVGDNLQVNYIKEVKLSGLGNGEEILAYAAPNNNFIISGIIGHNQDLLILQQDIFHLSSKFGIRIHGIIGYDMFSDFIIRINYQAQTITFFNPKKYKYKSKKCDVILPIEVHEHKPYVWTKLMQDDSTIVHSKMLIDTGGSHAIWLDISSNDSLYLPQKKKRAHLGKGLRGDIEGFLGRSSKLVLNDIELHNLTTAFPDSSSIIGVKGQGNRNGSIGSEILRRFDVIFDYPNKRMILRPNSMINDEFNYNMAGIEVYAPVSDQAIFLISSVDAGSPAAGMKIQKDDQITHINGEPSGNFSIHDIYELFHSKEGKKIRLTLQRNAETKERWTIEFRLENPI